MCIMCALMCLLTSVCSHMCSYMGALVSATICMYSHMCSFKRVLSDVCSPTRALLWCAHLCVLMLCSHTCALMLCCLLSHVCGLTRVLLFACSCVLLGRPGVWCGFTQAYLAWLHPRGMSGFFHVLLNFNLHVW